MDIQTLIGFSGALLILIAFILNQFGVLKNSSFTYDFINLIGGSVLIYYSVLLDSIPFLLLNIVWTFVSLKDVILGLSQKT